MMALEDFILNNTVWIVTIAILFALALIGYIADSNGFLNKDTKNNKKEKTKKEKKNEDNFDELDNDILNEESEQSDLPFGSYNELVDNSNNENTFETENSDMVKTDIEDDNEQLVSKDMEEESDDQEKIEPIVVSEIDDEPSESDDSVVSEMSSEEPVLEEEKNEDEEDMALINKDVEIQPLDDEELEEPKELIEDTEEEEPEELIEDTEEEEPKELIEDTEEEEPEELIGDTEEEEPKELIEDTEEEEPEELTGDTEKKQSEETNESLDNDFNYAQLIKPIEDTEELEKQDDDLMNLDEEDNKKDVDDLLLEGKTQPLNIEKDFEKLLEDEDDSYNDTVEKIDDDLWKF